MVIAVVAAVVAVVGVVLVRPPRSPLSLGTPEDQATYRILHITGIASPELRAGLEAGAERAARHCTICSARPRSR